jgi:hypothetical protein
MIRIISRGLGSETYLADGEGKPIDIIDVDKVTWSIDSDDMVAHAVVHLSMLPADIEVDPTFVLASDQTLPLPLPHGLTVAQAVAIKKAFELGYQDLVAYAKQQRECLIHAQHAYERDLTSRGLHPVLKFPPVGESAVPSRCDCAQCVERREQTREERAAV